MQTIFRRMPDTKTEPMVGATPGYSFKNKVATCYEAKRTGSNFLPLPGAYFPAENQTIRGGMYPRTTDIVPGTVSLGSVVGGEEAPPKMKKVGLGK